MAIKNITLIKTHLFLCNGGTCKLKGAEESTEIIRQEIINHGLSDEVHTTKTLCNGRCKDGPVVISQPQGIWFREVTREFAPWFVQQYLINKTIPAEHRLFAYGEKTINAVEQIA
jgi:(2Fe-2S) ferredoxin